MNYSLLAKQIKYLIEPVDDEIANLANISALLNEEIKDINWVGFYMVKDNHLVLGPFQGKVACTYIEFGKGVCGTCYNENKTILVKNVHEFPGHIACDSRSNSEIVIPLHKNNEIHALLDIDSASLSRFDESDKNGLEMVTSIIEGALR